MEFTGFGTDGQCAEHVAAGSVFCGNREEKNRFYHNGRNRNVFTWRRSEGFYQGISEYGMTPVGKCSLPYITYDNPVEARGEIYRKQIAEYVERYSKELEGIVCGEYSVAMETEAVLEAKALKGRIEVCCMDENHIGSGQYKLTHIRQDEQKIAQCAMERMLDKLIGNTGEEKDYLIPGIFMEKIASEKE